MTGRTNYVTAEQAVRAVRDGDYIDYGFGGSFPELLDTALAARGSDTPDPQCGR